MKTLPHRIVLLAFLYYILSSMALGISIDKSVHRFDSGVFPNVAVSGITNIGKIKVQDWSYFQVPSNSFAWQPPNRTQDDCTLRLRNVFRPTWTLGSGISTTTNGDIRRSSGGDAFGGAHYNTALNATNASIEAKTTASAFTLTGGISLQSGTIQHDYSSGTNAVEHAILFGMMGVGSIYESGSLIKRFKYDIGDKGLIEKTGAVVRYFLVKSDGTLELLRTTRSTLAGNIYAEVMVYHDEAQLDDIFVWNNEETSASFNNVGVLDSLHNWEDELQFIPNGESIQMADNSLRWTYAGRKQVLRGMQLSRTGADKETVRDLYVDFFAWHKNEKEFLFKDFARKEDDLPTEFWARFASPLSDKTRNGCRFQNGTAIIEVDRDEYIPLERPPDVIYPEEVSYITYNEVTHNSLTVAWDMPLDNVGVTGYLLQRATNSSFTVGLQEFNLGAVLTYEDTGLTPETTYYHRIKAHDAEGNYSLTWSAVISETTLPAPDLSPTITTTSLPNIVNGVAYNQTINFTPGNGAHTASIVAGSLPPGTSLGTVGASSVPLTGTSTVEDDYTFTMRVIDADGDFDDQVFTVSVVPVPATDAIFVIDGDSRFRQSYYDSAPAGTNLTDQVAALLTGTAVVANISRGGGALDTGAGELNLTASLGTRLGTLFDGGETYKIIIINSSFNDLMHNITPAAYMTKLQGYVTEAYNQGATHVIVFSPSESDYLGQRGDIHAKNRAILELLRTEFTDATPFGSANTRYINISSDNVIGLGADTHDTDLYYEGVGDSGKLHYGSGHNEINAPYLAEMVKRIVGTVTTPSIPSGLKVTVNNQTEIEITVDPAADGIAVTSRSYRLNEGAAVSMGTALSVTVSGLSVGTSYAVEVLATNGAGSSGWSDPKTVYTHPDITGWTPATLTTIWLEETYQDPAQTTPATALNDPVGAWRDMDGVDHFTETTAKPVLKPASIGNLKGVLFEGNDKLSNPTAGSLFTGDFTWIKAVKISTPGYGTSRVLVQAGDVTPREMRLSLIYPFSGFFAFSGWSDSSSTGVDLSTEIDIADGNPHILTTRKTGTLVEMFIDRQLVVSGRPDLLSFTSALMQIGMLTDGSRGLQGHIGEPILVPSSLSDLNLHRAHNYLNAAITGGGGGGGTPADAIYDTFTAADSTPVTGRTPAPTDNGETWEAIAGAFGIFSNKAFGSNTDVSLAVLESNGSNAVITAVYGGNGGNAGIVARLTDANNFFSVYFSGTDIQIYKCEGGLFTTVGSSAAHTLASGDVLEFRTDDNNLEIWVNSVQKTATTSAFNNTATKHGMRSISGTSYNEFQIAPN